MGHYVKKTVTGYKESAQTDATHYIQTIEEFNNSVLDKKRVRTELKNVLTSLPLRESELLSKHEQHIRQLQEEYEQQLFEECERSKKLQDELDAMTTAKTASDELNRNLIRIAKERANAARGITPKAKKDGYLLLSVKQVRDYQEIRHDWEMYNKQPSAYRKKHRFTPIERLPRKAWKLLIQTPYDIGASINAVQQQIIDELQVGIFPDIGISGIADNDFMPTGNDSPCIAYKYFFQANLKASLWEVEVYTTADVIVPECRRQYLKPGRKNGR